MIMYKLNLLRTIQMELCIDNRKAKPLKNVRGGRVWGLISALDIPWVLTRMLIQKNYFVKS